MADTQPPQGFRGVFLWALGPAEEASAPQIPSMQVAQAISAICRAPLRAAPDGSSLGIESLAEDATTGGTPTDSPASTPTVGASARAPLAGIVVLGRWLGAKPGDEAWRVDAVDVVGDGFTVVMDRGRIQVSVRAPGPATLTPGPYGQLLTISAAQRVVVTVNGEPAHWMPSVQAGQAHDMGGRARPWPLRRAPGGRSWRAQRFPVPALMLSVWWAGPLPPGLALPSG